MTELWRMRPRIIALAVAGAVALHVMASAPSGDQEASNDEFILMLTASPDVGSRCKDASVDFEAWLPCVDFEAWLPCVDPESATVTNAGISAMQVTASGGGLPLTRSIDIVQADNVTVSVSPEMASINSTNIQVTAIVTCGCSPVSGLTVSFSADGLTFYPAAVNTDSNGVAVTIAMAGSTPSPGLDETFITASVDDGIGVVVEGQTEMTLVRINNPTPVAPHILVGGYPDNDLYTETFTFTVSPLMPGVPVEFSLDHDTDERVLVYPQLEEASSATDSEGKATVRVRSSSLRETVTVTCTYQESSGSTIVTFDGLTGISVEEHIGN